MQPCDLTIRAGILLTCDLEQSVIHDAGLAVAHGKVAGVGPFDEIADKFEPAEFRDLRYCMVLPGLVNAHTHTPMTLLRGFCDDLPLLEWLESNLPIETALTDELIHTGTLLACAEMIRTGTTSFMDGYMRMENTADAAHEAGLRAILSEGFFKFPSPMFPTAEDAWATMHRLKGHCAEMPLVDAAIFPHTIYTTDPDSLLQSFEIAEKWDSPWQIHCAETPAETALVLEQFGKRPIPYLHDLGLLTPRTVLHHMVDVDEADIAMVAEAGAAIVHNPESNMKLASGTAPVMRFLEAGIPVGLGTDGPASNNDLNMFTEMTSAALLQKVHLRDAAAMDAGTTLHTATLGSARAMRLENSIGSLTPGKSADLCALDLSAPNLQPMHDPTAAVVYSASGHENVLTMVAGKILYDHGTYTTIDYPELIKQGAEAANWVRSRK